MEFYIDTNELQRVVKLLGSTAKTNVVGPAGLILMEAFEDNTVSFLSNNGVLAISTTATDVIVKNPGTILVSYSAIKSFIMPFSPWNGTFGAKGFNILAEGNNISLKVDNIYEDGKKSKGKLKLDSFDAFSVRQPKSFDGDTFVLNSNIFKTAVSKILYAIDPNDNRQSIQGMNIRFDADNIYFAGTNGLVLSEYKIKNISELTEGNFVLKHSFIMSLKSAILEETQLSFGVNKSNIKVEFGNACLYGTMDIGSVYPNYAPNLEAFENTVKLSKEVLISGLAPFVDVLDSDDYNRLTLSIKDRKVVMYNDMAKFEYSGEVAFEGDFVIDINGILMSQTVYAIKDDSLYMKFSNDKGLLIFDSANFEDQKALITPIRRR
jgi:DNA polymerase III sliding clamp (beta) subunit (PCNA family)